MRVSLIMIWLFLAVLEVNALTVTEIMFDPEGKDDLKEFVEIKVDGEDIDGYIIEDSSSKDIIRKIKFTNEAYAVILENNSMVNVSSAASVYVVGAAIGNGLHNTADNITIFNREGAVIDSVFYSSSYGRKGLSICRNGESWQECIPTPGEENLLETYELYANKAIEPVKEDIKYETKKDYKKSNFEITRWKVAFAFLVAAATFIILYFLQKKNGNSFNGKGNY